MADRHNLAHRLHARPYLPAHTRELRQVPPRYLADQIVELRSIVGRVGCSPFAYLVKRVAQRYLCGYEGKGIARCLRCQRRRTAQPGVDLYDAVVVCLGVERKLYVALADDVEMSHTLDGDVLQHLHLIIAQRADRGDNDTLARVDAQRVEILHRGNGEASVASVSDTLKLYLLPTFQTLLDQYLPGKGEGRLGCQPEAFFV